MIWFFKITSWKCHLQVSSAQDTPELLGFLRNTTAPPQRHRRAVSSSQGSIGKTLVSFVLSLVRSRSCGASTCFTFALQNCTNVSCLRISCVIGRLDQRRSAVVKIRSRLWVQTFLQVRISLPPGSPSSPRQHDRLQARLTSCVFTLQHRNSPYILNSTVSFEVRSMPYRVQPSLLPKHTTSVGCFDFLRRC